MGRKKENVIESKRLSEILFLISQGKNYNEIISAQLKIKPSSTFAHLERLTNEKFLISKEEKKQYNRTLYSINWSEINKRFFLYIKQLVSKKIEVKESYYSNEYLILYFKKMFEYKDLIKIKTLEELFRLTFNTDLSQRHLIHLYKDTPKDEVDFLKQKYGQGIIEFIEILELISPFNLADDVFTEMVSKVLNVDILKGEDTKYGFVTPIDRFYEENKRYDWEEINWRQQTQKERK